MRSLWRILRTLLIPALALLTAFIIGAIIMLIFGDNPIQAYQGLFNGAFGGGRAWSLTILGRTTPWRA